MSQHLFNTLVPPRAHLGWTRETSRSWNPYTYRLKSTHAVIMSDKEFGNNDDLSLPKATVQKIISEVLPQLPHEDANSSKEGEMTFTRPARDLLISCSLEFLRMLSSESNDISERESKKTISVEHVEQALTDLGFGSYIESCRGVVGEWQEVQKKRIGRGEKMRNFGGFDKMGEEELRKMQEALLGEARGRMEGGGAGQNDGQ
ncbi:hypothetical protein AYL99_05130 [Fonsecaea erecta]|uniref:Transcription factor CBF/NF-Y/archaeal histone domain-containing protein n=1 Tax=Fonsecaea erecta TaxID=1367422 RepID=A0A178ZK00_9EURO|nr:hypothetical protein AYL99_05130 [Fonsecaea erecta]OAP60128.1 hypothetical protein AYL99_05130 [Fonsecaea erecta]